jgi:hypothetical protein
VNTGATPDRPDRRLPARGQRRAGGGPAARVTAAAVDSRLAGLQAELDGHALIARYLGLDFGLPVRSLGDGYPENAVSWVGKITERLLKRLWRHNEVAGTPAGKTLTDLIGGCRPYIRSHAVIEALRDIQRLRNRAAHDSITIAEEDCPLPHRPRRPGPRRVRDPPRPPGRRGLLQLTRA